MASPFLERQWEVKHCSLPYLNLSTLSLSVPSVSPSLSAVDVHGVMATRRQLVPPGSFRMVSEVSILRPDQSSSLLSLLISPMSWRAIPGQSTNVSYECHSQRKRWLLDTDMHARTHCCRHTKYRQTPQVCKKQHFLKRISNKSKTSWFSCPLHKSFVAKFIFLYLYICTYKCTLLKMCSVTTVAYKWIVHYNHNIWGKNNI